MGGAGGLGVGGAAAASPQHRRQLSARSRRLCAPCCVCSACCGGLCRKACGVLLSPRTVLPFQPCRERQSHQMPGSCSGLWPEAGLAAGLSLVCGDAELS